MGSADRARACADRDGDPAGGRLPGPVRIGPPRGPGSAAAVGDRVEYQTPAIEDRAVEVLTLLADRGQHWAPSIPDLIIAATAELTGLAVLHADKDFEIIASITGQPLERLNVN